MAVVGSGIMAEKLAGGNQAIALLCNTIATGAVLFVIITIFAPVSGAHFNPAVSLVMLLSRRARSVAPPSPMSWCRSSAAASAPSLAHLMFGLDLFQLGSTARTGIGQWAGEFIATFGLIATILGCVRFKPERDGHRCRPLHHLGLLVHVIHVLRQSGGHHRRALSAIPSPALLRRTPRASSSPSCLAPLPRRSLFGWLFAAPVKVVKKTK